MIGVQSVFAGGTSFCIYIADWEAENMRLDARLQAVADFVNNRLHIKDGKVINQQPASAESKLLAF